MFLLVSISNRYPLLRLVVSILHWMQVKYQLQCEMMQLQQLQMLVAGLCLNFLFHSYSMIGSWQLLPGRHHPAFDLLCPLCNAMVRIIWECYWNSVNDIWGAKEENKNVVKGFLNVMIRWIMSTRSIEKCIFFAKLRLVRRISDGF